MKHFIFLISLFVIIMVSGNCIAFEPPSIPVEDAILKGKIAFIGRVVKLEEIAEGDFESTAIAEIKVHQTFYGLDAKKGDIVKIKYHSKVFSGYPNPGFSANFQISNVILFIFNNKNSFQTDRLYFNSYWNNPHIQDSKIDLAYYAANDPKEQYSENRVEHGFVSIYMPGCRSRLVLNEFFKLVEKREKELGTGN